MLIKSTIKNVLFILLTPTLFLIDLIFFSLTGLNYFLISFYLLELINKKSVINLIYILSFISLFSLFKQTLIIDIFAISALSFFAIKLQKSLTSNTLCAYIILSIYIGLDVLEKWLILGLKWGLLYTFSIFTAILIYIYILTFFTRYRLDNR